MSKIKPVSATFVEGEFEFANYFLNKARLYFKGENKSWEYEINMIIRAALKWGNGKKVVDIGCGIGELLQTFSKYGFECHGIDYDPIQVKFAKDFARERGVKNIYFYNYEMEDIENHHLTGFNVATSKNVAEHLPDDVLHEYLKQSYGLLKKGGILVVFTKPTKYTYLFLKQRVLLLIPFRFLSEERFERLLRFMDRFFPIFYKKITGHRLSDTWQDPPPVHCNCHVLERLSDMVEQNNFEVILSQSLVGPHQKYFKLLERFFPYAAVRPNILLVARK